MIEVICSGCGSTWPNDQLAMERIKNPSIVSCCPERKPLNITEWMAMATAADERSRQIRETLSELYHAINYLDAVKCMPDDDVRREMAVTRFNRAMTSARPFALTTRGGGAS